MKLAIKATTSLVTLTLCAALNAAAASGVGHTSGNGSGSGAHQSGGVGGTPSISVGDPLPSINIDSVSLGTTGATHNPSPNQPGIHFTGNPNTHNPSPNIPRVDLGRSNVQHTPTVAVPNLNYNQDGNSYHNAGINVGINLPNLNLNIRGMTANVIRTGGGGGYHGGGGGGCHDRCGGHGGGDRTRITVNNSVTNNVHNETNVTTNNYFGGGGTYIYNEDRTPIYIENFNIEGEVMAHQGLIPLRAVCLDGSGGVHPASQVFAEESVAESFSGEIYRCVIGTHMQYTMGEMVDGERSFEHAWSETCAAGEALRYADGELTCAPQEERRPCNERSLLRRHGPGDKLVVLRGMAMNSSVSFGSLGLDGGVGAYRR